MKLRTLCSIYLRAGLYSFSAGASEVLHRHLVERLSVLSSADFSALLSLATLSPGPFHVNLVIATAYRLAGFGGAFLATLFFVLPGFIAAVVVVHFLANEAVHGYLSAHPGIAAGMTASVAGLVLSVVAKLQKGALPHGIWLLPLLAALFALYFLKIPLAAAVIAGGLLGGILRRWFT